MIEFNGVETLYYGYTVNQGSPSQGINIIMAGISWTGVGSVVAGAWFIADFGTMGVNYLRGNGAVGLGDMLDNNIGTIEMYEGLY
jgi:hypothetical protein